MLAIISVSLFMGEDMGVSDIRNEQKYKCRKKARKCLNSLIYGSLS